jgi:hypothetical protein
MKIAIINITQLNIVSMKLGSVGTVKVSLVLYELTYNVYYRTKREKTRMNKKLNAKISGFRFRQILKAKALKMYRTLMVFLVSIVYGLEKETARFVLDTRAESSEFTAPIMMVISGIIWVICTPIFVNQVQSTSVTGWNFTGSAGAITLFQLLPFIFIAGGVIWIVKKAMGT